MPRHASLAQLRGGRWRPSTTSNIVLVCLVAGPAVLLTGLRTLAASRRSEKTPAETAVQGYAAATQEEQAGVNLLSAFLLTLAGARAVNYVLEQRRPPRPWKRLTSDDRIHHFVPGVAIAFASGAAGVLARGRAADPWLALPFGSGIALTLDEVALMVELEDVYWRSQRLVLVQGTIALAAAVLLAIRLLRRGERAAR